MTVYIVGIENREGISIDSVWSSREGAEDRILKLKRQYLNFEIFEYIMDGIE